MQQHTTEKTRTSPYIQLTERQKGTAKTEHHEIAQSYPSQYVDLAVQLHRIRTSAPQSYPTKGKSHEQGHYPVQTGNNIQYPSKAIDSNKTEYRTVLFSDDFHCAL